MSRRTDRPPQSWIEKYVRAAAVYAAAGHRGASISVQQRLYAKLMRIRADGQSKWPNVDFDSGLQEAIQSYTNKNPIVGPGKDW